MDGLKHIMDGTKELMNELFDGVRENGGALRSMAEHLGVTDVCAIVETVLEGGLNEEMPYPVLHFHITLAQNVPDAAADNICVSLNELNNVTGVGEYPCFGSFAYYPRLNQIYLTYRLPVNPEAPEDELVNIRYYFGVLYEQLDLFADFIMLLCDSGGNILSLEEYVDYLAEIQDMNDIEERVRLLEKRMKEAESIGAGTAEEEIDG
ncbi:MAG: hypothetical protein IJT24_03820 [Lachnospiraceae bacterium]|nr:hypothetical protein [Lachnospiraceae bacterium]